MRSATGFWVPLRAPGLSSRGAGHASVTEKSPRVRCARCLLGGIVLTCVLMAGCGQSDDRAQVRAVAERFFGAVAAGDGAAACAELSADTRSQLESQEGRDCRDAVTGLTLEGGRLTREQVFVTNAKVDLASGQSAFLSRTEQGWRLSAVGCEPEGGKPADRPYDCELEA